MTYNVFGGTLNLAQSINQSMTYNMFGGMLNLALSLDFFHAIFWGGGLAR